ncbi:MAG: hemerythrin domain-containing protein [Pseudomonadota bacterium]|nr:hemerythrin domain-containing protein [Pseudomonadota bacterium]
MRKTERFRKDHEGLLLLATELSKQLKADALEKDATSTCKLLAKFTGVLKIHLSAEDNNLYPELLKSTDKKVRDTAIFFQKEMGGIKGVVTNYFTKWGTPRSVQKDPHGFIKETLGLFEALKARIDKENNVLYDLADKMAA